MVYYKVKQCLQGYHEVFEVTDNYYLRFFDEDDDFSFVNLADAKRVFEHLVADYSTHLEHMPETINVTRNEYAPFGYACVEIWDGIHRIAYREFWIDEILVQDRIDERWAKILNE